MTEHDGVAGHLAYVNLADLLTHQATVEPDAEAAVQPLPERNAMLRTCGVAVVLPADHVTELEAATRPLTSAVAPALAQPDGGPVTSPRGATGQVQKGRLRGTLAEADR